MIVMLIHTRINRVLKKKKKKIALRKKKKKITEERKEFRNEIEMSI